MRNFSPYLFIKIKRTNFIDSLPPGKKRERKSEIYLQQPGIPSLPRSIFRKVRPIIPSKVYLFLSTMGNRNALF